MGLHYENLDSRTRELMLSETELDIASNSIYLSSYLNSSGTLSYPYLLAKAEENGSDNSLADDLRRGKLFKLTHQRKHPKGMGFVNAKVPITAPQTLAESQFNLYYIRALCLRAIEEGFGLEVYRARSSERPRPESENMIGKRLDPHHVLEVLRTTKGVTPSIGIPMPNSGLSVRLIRSEFE